MSRYKSFDSTGLAPSGRLYAGDLNAIQDRMADLYNLGQNIGVSSLTLGEAALQIIRYGSLEARLTGAFRTDGMIRALGGLFIGGYTTTQRDAILAGSRPFTAIIFNTTTARFEYNAGTDTSPNWQPLIPALGSGSITLSMLAANSVDSSKIVDGSITGSDIATATITDANVASANKDGAAGTPSMRTLGSGATQAVAGNDSRLSDQRVPINGSVTPAKLDRAYVTGAGHVEYGVGVSFNGTVHVNFAQAFGGTPVVIAGVMDGNPGANGGSGEPPNYVSWVSNVGASGFDLSHGQGGTRTVPWHAIGP